MAQASIPIILLAMLCIVAFLKSNTALLSAPVITISSARDGKKTAPSAQAVPSVEPVVKRRLRGDDLDSFRIRPSIILFGDSITQISFGHPGNNGIGYGSLLAATYARRADVLNRGFAGYNTKWAVDRLLPSVFTGPVAVAQRKRSLMGGAKNSVEVPPVLFVAIMFGTNDMSDKGTRAHVHIKEYGQNLNAIVEHIKNTMGPETPIVMMTPPPFSKTQYMEAKKRDKPEHGNTRARAYGFKVKQIARDHDLALVDTWHLLEGTTGEENFGKKYLYDGMHPNDEGNRVIYNGIMNALKERYPQVLPMADGQGKNGVSGVPLEGQLWQYIRDV